MVARYDHTNEELDALIQDISSKLSDARGLQHNSQAYTGLKRILEDYNIEQKERNASKSVENKEPVACETDPDMAGVEFIPSKRHI